nr:unnamed protein product [Callosobruchus analis]
MDQDTPSNPSEWCKLAYWELSERVGPLFSVDRPSFNVFGDVPHPDGLSLETLAMTGQRNGYRGGGDGRGGRSPPPDAAVDVYASNLWPGGSQLDPHQFREGLGSEVFTQGDQVLSLLAGDIAGSVQNFKYIMNTNE